MDPSVFDAGLWLDDRDREIILRQKNENDASGRHYNDLSVSDYLARRSCPILIIYPIELKLDSSAEELRMNPNIQNIKQDVKNMIHNNAPDGKPLFAFAFGFPRKEEGVYVKYRANKRKLDEMNANLEISDEDEGVEDED
jgi:hypothetical protein